jgi:predicted dehydrogenase
LPEAGVLGSEEWGTEPEAAWGTLTAEGTPEKRKVETLPGNYMAFYDNLYNCIARSGKIAVKPEEAANVIRIIEAAQHSDTEGRTVRLSRP